MKTYKIKLVVEDYVDVNIDELVKEIKQNLPVGVLLVKSSATEIEC
ncbi:MAG: hypothetical protein ACYC5G_04055 [Candidatus Doudnabacteria bacterium]